MQLPHLRCSKAEAIKLIDEHLRRGQQIDPSSLLPRTAQRRYRKWDREAHALLMHLFDKDRYAKEFKALTEGVKTVQGQSWQTKLADRLNAKIGLLTEYQQRIEKDLIGASEQQTDFWSLIHPEIIKVTKTRFDTGHYADCAEAAFKHINSVIKDLVKTATGKELDGASLMKNAFSPNNPLIEIDTVATETGRNIQQGYMEIFAGSMTGIRNPKAHAVIEIGKERAIHFIFLASMLMDTIDIALQRYRY